MADSSLAVTPGAGANVDTRTTSNGDHREVVVLGAPAADDTLSTTTPSTGRTILDVNMAISGSGIANATGALTGVNSTVATAVGNSGNGTVLISGGTFTVLPIAFEASLDGSLWFPIDVVRSDGQQVISSDTITSQAVLPRVYNFMAPGYANVRVRQTAAAATQSVNPTVTITQGPFLYDPSPTSPPIDGVRATYSASINGTSVAGAVTGSVPLWELVNAGTRLVRVTRISWQLTLATAGTAPLIILQKRTAASTGGTAVAQTSTSHDSTDLVSQVTSKYYTAIPTLAGALVGIIRTARRFAVATVLTATPQDTEWVFGTRSKALLLRPGESANIQGIAAFGTVPTLTGDVEWTEE